MHWLDYWTHKLGPGCSPACPVGWRQSAFKLRGKTYFTSFIVLVRYMWIQLHQCCFCIKCRYCHLRKQLWKGKNVHHFSKTFITYCVYLTHLATWKATVLMTSDHLCKLDGYGGPQRLTFISDSPKSKVFRSREGWCAPKVKLITFCFARHLNCVVYLSLSVVLAVQEASSCAVQGKLWLANAGGDFLLLFVLMGGASILNIAWWFSFNCEKINSCSKIKILLIVQP